MESDFSWKTYEGLATGISRQMCAAAVLTAAEYLEDQHGVHSLEIVAFCAGAVVILAIWSFASSCNEHYRSDFKAALTLMDPRSNEKWALTIATGVFNAASIALLFHSTKQMQSAADSASLVQLPELLLTPVAAYTLFRHKPSKWLLVSAALSIAGGLLIWRPHFLFQKRALHLSGMSLALLSGCFRVFEHVTVSSLTVHFESGVVTHIRVMSLAICVFTAMLLCAVLGLFVPYSFYSEWKQPWQLATVALLLLWGQPLFHVTTIWLGTLSLSRMDVTSYLVLVQTVPAFCLFYDKLLFEARGNSVTQYTGIALIVAGTAFNQAIGSTKDWHQRMHGENGVVRRDAAGAEYYEQIADAPKVKQCEEPLLLSS